MQRQIKDFAVRCFASAAVLSVAAASVAPALHAQASEMVTDRPDQTESAEVVPVGTFQLETGWTTARSEDGAAEVTTGELFGTLVRVGLAERWELRLGWDGETEVETRGPEGRRTVDGSGDGEVGFKVQFRQEDDRGPAVALLAGVALPVGDRRLTADENDLSALLSVAHTLSDRLSLGYNVGWGQESEVVAEGRTETEELARYSAALGVDLPGRWGAFAEVFGAFGLTSGAEDRHGADAGVTFALLPNLQLDAAAGVGLDGAADDEFVTLGLSLRLPR